MPRDHFDEGADSVGAAADPGGPWRFSADCKRPACSGAWVGFTKKSLGLQRLVGSVSQKVALPGFDGSRMQVYALSIAITLFGSERNRN
jgi:hypothetical protein